jgi:hypothetical protein
VAREEPPLSKEAWERVMEEVRKATAADQEIPKVPLSMGDLVLSRLD